MNYIDMFIMVLLIWAVFKGYTRGFIMQLATIAALVIGIYAALKLSGFTAKHLERYLNTSSESLYLISMAVTFILVFIGINFVGHLVEKMVETVELSFVNRLLGVLFSVIKTMIIIGIILAFANRLDQKVSILPKYTREHSLFYKPFTRIATILFPSLQAEETPDVGRRNLVGVTAK
jgi:membrane protein required for colicin V production